MNMNIIYMELTYIDSYVLQFPYMVPFVYVHLSLDEGLLLYGSRVWEFSPYAPIGGLGHENYAF